MRPNSARAWGGGEEVGGGARGVEERERGEQEE